MKIREKIFWCLFAGLVLQSAGSVVHDEYTKSKAQDLRKKIENKTIEAQRIPAQVKKQERDSVALFNTQSPAYQDLIQKRAFRQDLQIDIARIVEKSMCEYWIENFPKYKTFIDVAFTATEKSELGRFVGVAHFTLSCDIDTNYYKTLDEILYGPYWREFAEFAEPVSPALIAKYKHVRAVAEKRFPYIYVRSVFYDGGKITKENPEYIAPYDDADWVIKHRGPIDSTDKYNSIFTESVKIGRDLLRTTSSQPQKYMTDFNRLHNMSKIFTADIHFLIESIFLYSDENIDLDAPVFKKYRPEILQMIKQILVLNPQVAQLELKHKSDVKQIEKHFDSVTNDKINNASQELQQLRIELATYNTEKTK